MKKNREPYPQVGEGDDEAADAEWKRKRGWTKMWGKVKNELSRKPRRRVKKR